MNILIKGMEMPANCFSCPFRRKVDPDNIMCIVTSERFEETFAGTIETRNRGNCPLAPIPPHGRLVDADDFIRQLSDGSVSDSILSGISYRMSKMPTVIEAEVKA